MTPEMGLSDFFFLSKNREGFKPFLTVASLYY